MTAAQALIVIAALGAANLPFLTRRALLGLPVLRQDKRFWLRFIELLLLYLIVGILAGLLEANAYGEAYTQGWEFYAVTFCLFLVLAYPGYVYRYLWKHRK